MLSLLKLKKIRGWCLFDFAISSFPTLIITFFYGAFYAKKIASSSVLGASLWGFAISSASVLSLLIFAIVLFGGNLFKSKIKSNFFKFFFYLLVFFSFSLVFFNEGTNQIIPLLFVIMAFISFEFVNLFYNISLFKMQKTRVGALSNLGWAFGYLGGLISLIVIFLMIQISSENEYKIFGMSVFLFIGPFVAIWTLVFGSSHFKNLESVKFNKPNMLDLIENLRSKGLYRFLISYFFFNNAVISIFAFASMFSAFLFGLTESQILFLGIFIIGCFILGRYEDIIGSFKTVVICILGLMVVTFLLFWIKKVSLFWILSLAIGFFIGPIQASSRSVLVKEIKAKNQLSAFGLYSMFGNICSVLGPLLIGVIIDFSGSIRMGMLIIPIFFFLALLPFLKKSMFKVSYPSKN